MFQAFEGINSHCRHFDLLLITVLGLSGATMIAVVAARVVVSDRPTVTGVMSLFDGALACSFNRHLRETRSSQ